MADALTIFGELTIGGLMGVVGQCLRTVVGLKKLNDEAYVFELSSSDLFETPRLLTSLLISFVVGIGTALALGPNNMIASGDGNVRYLLGVAAAGYACTDFIEGFVARTKLQTRFFDPSVGVSDPNFIFGMIDDAQRLFEVRLSWAARQMLAIPVIEQVQDGRLPNLSVAENSIRMILQTVHEDRGYSSRTRSGASNSVSVIRAFANLFCNIPPFCAPTEESSRGERS